MVVSCLGCNYINGVDNMFYCLLSVVSLGFGSGLMGNFLMFVGMELLCEICVRGCVNIQGIEIGIELDVDGFKVEVIVVIFQFIFN